MGYGIFGYIEVRDKAGNIEGSEWRVYKELETGDLPRGSLAHLIFGYGSSNDRPASLFKDRGLPIDATGEVSEEYDRQRQLNPAHGGYYRDMFGHSYVSYGELSPFLLEKIEPLYQASQEHDFARLLVWFNR